MTERSECVTWKTLSLVLGIGFVFALLNQIASAKDEFGAPATGAWFVLFFVGLCSANTLALSKNCAWRGSGSLRPLPWRIICSAIAGATLAFWQVGLAWYLCIFAR